MGFSTLFIGPGPKTTKFRIVCGSITTWLMIPDQNNSLYCDNDSVLNLVVCQWKTEKCIKSLIASMLASLPKEETDGGRV